MINEATIQARITALETELERYVAQANTQIAAYNGAIGELKRLIAPETPVQMEYVEQIVPKRAE